MKTYQKGLLVALLVIGAGAFIYSQTRMRESLPVVSPAVPAQPVESATTSAPIVLPQATEQDIDAVIIGNNAFAFDLYDRLAGENQNLFFSPYSLDSAFAMVYEGARGATAGQIGAVFGFPAASTVREPAFKALNAGLNQPNSTYALSVANALWLQKDFALLPSYTDVVSQVYGGKASLVDYVSDPQSAVDTINAWSALQTHDKIPEILTLAHVNNDTRLVLTNAVYFKGTWKSPFDKSATHTAHFNVGGSHKTPPTGDVQMMEQNDHFSYAETDSLQALEMPYEGDKLAMLVLLPKATDGTESIEKGLSSDSLSAIRSHMTRREVDISFPKFTFSTSYTLNDDLKALGLVDAFSDAADFSGIVAPNQGGLTISTVIHKAYIAVDEQGTEAAAVTAIVAVGTSAMVDPLPPVTFTADHPFIFIIEDVQNGNILFIGRVDEP